MDPSCGCEFGDALDGRVGEPGEDGAEVVAHRDEPAGAFNRRQDGGQEQAGHRVGPAAGKME